MTIWRADLSCCLDSSNICIYCVCVCVCVCVWRGVGVGGVGVDGRSVGAGCVVIQCKMG